MSSNHQLNTRSNALSNALSALKSPQIAATVAALSAASLPAANADGSIVRDGARPASIALGGRYVADPLLNPNPLNQGGGAAALSVFAPDLGITSRGSIVMINESWGLTAAHSFTNIGTIGTMTVRTGPNYNSNPGATFTADYFVNCPFGAPSSTTSPDLALVHFSTPQTWITPAVFGTYSMGEILTGVGYGRWGTPAIGQQPRDGNVGGYNAQAGAPGLAYNSVFYGDMAAFTNPITAVDGFGAIGDSGGPIYNATGQLVGIATQASQTAFFPGGTAFARLDNPQVLDWIQTTTGVPSPAGAALLGLAGLYSASRRRN